MPRRHVVLPRQVRVRGDVRRRAARAGVRGQPAHLPQRVRAAAGGLRGAHARGDRPKGSLLRGMHWDA